MPTSALKSLRLPLVLSFSFAALALPVKGAEPVKVRFVDELADGHRQKIVVYGTSLTANSDWPQLLKDKLTDDFGNKVKIVNAALGGMDSRWGVANVRKRVMDESPDVVFIEFAVNDAMASSKLSTTESRGNLEQMIDVVRTERPDCEVILMIMNPPTGKSAKARPEYHSYEQVCREVAGAYQCPLIDFSGRWKRVIARHPQLWRNYAPDGLHPNGQAAAEVIMPQMLKQLGLPPDRPLLVTEAKKS